MPNPPIARGWNPPGLKGKIAPEAEQAIRVAYDQINDLYSQVGQVAAAQTSTSLTLAQLQQIQQSLQNGGQTPLNITGLSGIAGSTQPSVIEDTHVNRVNYPASQFQRVLYFEVDRFVMYLSVLAGGVWVWLYVTGIMNDTSSSLAGLPTGLGAADVGFLYRNQYFERLWRWSGSQWNYADGGLGAGAVVATANIFGGPPDGGLWQQCDGVSLVSIAGDHAGLSTALAAGPSGTTGVTWYMRR